MRAALIGVVAVIILVVGSFLGVTALLLVPLVGIVAALALVIWLLARRAEGKPPIR